MSLHHQRWKFSALLVLYSLFATHAAPAQTPVQAQINQRLARPETAGCYTIEADAPVFTPGGLVRIGSLRAGDIVKSRDPDTQEDVTRRVLRIRRGPMSGAHVLDDEFSEQVLAPGQLLWMQSKGWVEARSIEEQDIIATASGDVSVYEFNLVNGPPPQGVEVQAEPPNNFFVGKAGLWVRGAGDVSMCVPRSGSATTDAPTTPAGSAPKATSPLTCSRNFRPLQA